MKNHQTLRICLGMMLALIAFFESAAQEPDFLFEQPYPYPLQHSIELETPYGFAEEVAPFGDSEGFYLMVVSDNKVYFNPAFESDSIFRPMVYKVSNNGEVIRELPLGRDRYSIVPWLFDDPDNPDCHLAVGLTHDSATHFDKPFLAKFDNDLNLLWEKLVVLPEPYVRMRGLLAYMDSHGNLLCQSAIPSPEASAEKIPIYFLLSPEGEIASGILEYPYPGGGGGDLFEYRDGSGDYGHIVTESESESFLVRINSDLQLTGRVPLPTQVNLVNTEDYLYYILALNPTVYNVVPTGDGSVIIMGDCWLSVEDYQFNWTDYPSAIGFLKLDQNQEIVSYGTVGTEEGDNMHTMNGTYLTCDTGDDAFCFFYMQGALNGFAYDYSDSFSIVKMDYEGNVAWSRYWNRYTPEYGMKVYFPNSITSCQDGGCLVSGFSYHSNVNGTQPDPAPEVFILKVFADGSLSVPELEALMRPYAFYPNPVEGMLRLDFSPDVQPASVELFDLQGRLVHRQDNSFESVNMSQLPAGIYTMRVTLNDGKSFSDKVVKE